MLAFLSILFFAGTALFAYLYSRNKNKLHLALGIVSCLMALVLMFLDPHLVLAVLLTIAAPIAIVVTLILLVIALIKKKKKLMKYGTVLVASFLVLVMAMAAIGTNYEGATPEIPEDPGSDVAQGPDEQPPYEPDPGEHSGTNDPGQNAPGDDPSGGGEIPDDTPVPGEDPAQPDPDPEPGDIPSGPEPEPGEEPQEPDPDEEEKLYGTVKVHYIDVGQGDSILIQAPEKTVLIDGGPKSAATTVVNYLSKQGVKTIDLLISTHPHEDHIGGLADVLKKFTVLEIIDPGIEHTSKTFENYLDLILEKDIPFTKAKPGITRNLGGTAELKILAPKSPSSSDLNNASVVAKLTFGTTSYLFMGDAENKAEQVILNSGSALGSTVLKIGHHGSETSTTQTFLNKVKPKYAVISCGTGNSYEHPRQSTLDKLKAGNINTYRTDTNGNVVIKSDGSKITVSTAKSADSKTVFTGADKQDPEPEPDPEPDPEPAPSDPDPGKGMFLGSTKSDKYHWPDCRHAKNILPENEVWFKDAKAALAAGYVPCGVCKPPRD